VTSLKENKFETLDKPDDPKSYSHDYKIQMDIATDFIGMIISKISNFNF